MRAALPEPGLVNIVLPDRQFGTCETVATTIVLDHVLPTDSSTRRLDELRAYAAGSR